MGIGSLHDIFHFRFNTLYIVLFTIFVLVSLPGNNAYAINWFTVLGGGVLSGYTEGDGIINNSIPGSSLPAGFNSKVVQEPSGYSGSETGLGALISSQEQDVLNDEGEETDDAYFYSAAALRF